MAKNLPNLLFFCCFSATVFAQKTGTLKFKMQQISSESFESAGVFDVNKDGNLDIVSGYFWYKGPTFKDRVYIGEIRREGEYWDDFSTIPMDVNGDGWTDFITGGWWGGTVRWLENPKGTDAKWTEHLVGECGNVETTRAYDVDNDGVEEIVPNNPHKPLVYFKKEADGQFKKIQVLDTQGHGLGFGDIDGDGRGDFVTSNGWIKSLGNGQWVLQKEFDFVQASVPIIVTDVNTDGLNDLIVGQAHGYGLDWYEQVFDKTSQKRSWKKHPIDPFNSQFHEMKWVDIDGDGQKELITGKRWRAHDGRDPGSDDNMGLYYYKWNGESFTKQIISYGPLGVGKGTGIYLSVADLDKSGTQDIVVAGKEGLYVFYNLGF